MGEKRRRGRKENYTTLPLSEVLAPPREEPQIPKRLGEFKLLRLVGEGAMGKVYEAVQGSLQRRVALKVLPLDFARHPQAVERFEREARAAAAMHHPNIVAVHGSGFEDGHYYYAMEFVEGRSLRDLLRDEQQPLSDERAIARYICQVAHALDYAHKQGVIHRDIKPDNILVRTEDDQALVTDFGLHRHEGARTITRVGSLMGTPNYMAPEQTMGGKIDHRVDVYALGATLYECLTGKIIFLHPDLRELLRLIKEEPPEPIVVSRPDVSPDLEAITGKALEKDPGDRYPTAKALADDLIRFFRGDVALARQPGQVTVALRQVRKHPAVAALVAALVLVVLGALYTTRAFATASHERGLETLAAAAAVVEEPLGRYREVAQQLAAVRRRGGGEDLNRLLLGFRAAEDALLAEAGQANGGAPADRALVLLNEARALLEAERGDAAQRARALALELVEAQRLRAERRGHVELEAACRRELAKLGGGGEGAAPPLLLVQTTPAGVAVSLQQVHSDERGRWSLSPPRQVGRSPIKDGLEVAPGDYVLTLRQGGYVEAVVPLTVPASLAGEQARVEVGLELPPSAGIPPGFRFVAPGETVVGGDRLAVRPLYVNRETEWVGAFFLAEREVTVAEYLEFLGALEPEQRREHVPPPLQLSLGTGDEPLVAPDCDDQPVVGVRLDSARAYCRWLSESLGVGLRFRLPTDVEWEKAARGPRGYAFPWGDSFDPAVPSPQVALHQRPADGAAGLVPAGGDPADVSLYGILGLGGNVSEWVEGSFGGDRRYGVLRGGSWARGPEVVRSASREPVDSSDQADFLRVYNRVGFRVALDIP